MPLNTTQLDEKLSVSGQISLEDLQEIAASGYKSIICNRPDMEGGSTQPTSTQLKQSAKSLGLAFEYLPVEINGVAPEHGEQFNSLMASLPQPILAFCGSGKRATALYHIAKQDLTGSTSKQPVSHACNWGGAFDIVIVGGGAAGIGVAASLLKRRSGLRIAIIEPSEKHYYQPAWTLVGGGAYDVADTERDTASVIPSGAQWIQEAVATFEPEQNSVTLTNGQSVEYRQLIVCPGIRLAWEKIDGLEETLGKNGVTSNYDFRLAPYTWSLVQDLKSGKALFTQPPMPIKCAGAPQKAMYLSCDHWLKNNQLKNINVEFHTAGAVLFGVAEFVPPLMEYVERYEANLLFNSNLVRVDGHKKIAYFEEKDQEDNTQHIEKSFDMLHVTPPQTAPNFLKDSPLADTSGFCEVDQKTLRHVRYENIFSLGDACSSPNAKTAAAARKQIVVVAENLLAVKEDREMPIQYDGYGACPLTVENGKVVLAEFGFGGKLLPTLPLEPTKASRFAWFLKAKLFPWLYWNGMLKGHEWMTKTK